MSVWTVLSRDEFDMEEPDHLVAGTYTSLDKAIRECADYIMERARLRPDDIGYMLTHDQNHPEFPKRGKRKQMDYIVDELCGHGCYYIYTEGYGSVCFDVDENDIVGEL